MSSGTAAARLNTGLPNGSRVGAWNRPASAIGVTSALPMASPSTVPPSRPSITATRRSMPVVQRKTRTVIPIVPRPRAMFDRSPKCGWPGRPKMSCAPTFTRFTPTMTIIVPITRGGKNLSSRVNSGRATK